MTESRKSLYFLIPILLIGLWFRAPMISTGLPFFYHEDEAHHFNRTVRMVQKGELNPKYFHKPSLHFYLRMPVVAASFLWNVKEGDIRSLKEIRTEDPYGIGGYAFTASHPGIVKWNRAFSVGLSMLIVLLVFLCARLLALSPATAGLAALLSAASPPLIRHSAVIGVDTLMAFMCMLTAYVSLRVFKEFSLRGLFLCGVVAGLAVSSKYNALPIVAIPLALCLLDRNINPKHLAIAIIAPVIGFFIGTPYSLVEVPLFLNHFAYEIWHYGVEGHVGHMAEPGLPQAAFYLSWFSSDAIGYLGLLASVLGAYFIIKNRGSKGALFLTFPALFFLLMVSQKANFTRNMISILPFLAVLAGCAFAEISKLLEKGPKTAGVALAALILLAQPISGALSERGSAKTIQETRLSASSWIEQNLQPFSDTAISGELWFQPSVLSLKGVSHFNPEKVPAESLYLAGYDRVVAGPLFEPDPTLLQTVHEFEGISEAKRVVKNPTIKVFSFNKDEQLRKRVRDYTTERGITNIRLPLTKGQPNAESSENANCVKEFQGTTLETNENHCWLSERIAKLSFENIGNLSSSSAKTFPISISVMTPWPNQQIVFSANGWKEKVSFQESEIGKWKKVDLEVPRSSQSIEIEVAQIHSPATQRVGLDSRRLGAAIQAAWLR